MTRRSREQSLDLRRDRPNRRALLTVLAAAGTSLCLASCAPSQPAPQPTSAPPAPAAPKPTAAAPAPATQQPAAKTEPPAAAKLRPATLRLNWLTAPNHTGFYLALTRGYYKEVGLDLQILEGKGTNATIQLIAQKNDTFGYAAADGVIKGVLQTAPLKAVACITQKGPQSIIARGDSGMKRVEDLPGRSLAGTTGGTSESVLPAVLAKANVDPNSFKFVPGDARTKLTLLRAGQVDALVGFVNDEAITLQLEGVNPVIIPFSDYGINLLGETLLVNTEWLKDNADMTRQFLSASLRGWNDTVKNPEDGAQALLQASKDIKPDYARLGLKVQIGLLHSKNTEGKPIGWQSADDWKQLQDLLKQYDLIKETRPVETYFTNDYLPAS